MLTAALWASAVWLSAPAGDGVAAHAGTPSNGSSRNAVRSAGIPGLVGYFE
jgi:hypothetical protein